jgi:hypothetical protein
VTAQLPQMKYWRNIMTWSRSLALIDVPGS